MARQYLHGDERDKASAEFVEQVSRIELPPKYTNAVMLRPEGIIRPEGSLPKFEFAMYQYVHSTTK